MILCEISFLVPNVIAFILQEEKNVWFFDCHLSTSSGRKMVLICLYIYISVCCINLIKSHAWYHTSLITFANECFQCKKKMLLNFVAIMKFYTSFYIIKWLCVAILLDSCIISFNLNCIMQLKQFYNIATKVSNRTKVLLLLVIYLTVHTFDIGVFKINLQK